MSTSESVEAEYAHGHHETVLKSHLWRTVENSAAFFVPYITPSMKILDVGCGPGNITTGLAKLVPDGSVIGIDLEEDIMIQARAYAESKGQKNVTFRTGNIFKLDFEDATFDAVYAHQVLQHLHDPVTALKEMKRVVKPGGIVAVRDMTHFLHYPETQELDKFRQLFYKISDDKGAVPGAGSMLQKFAREAGFERDKITVTASTWCFTVYGDLEWWCGKYQMYKVHVNSGADYEQICGQTESWVRDSRRMLWILG
jgi:ubiquinone/menaquinone biosynthesis C-methylase UbiE